MTHIFNGEFCLGSFTDFSFFSDLGVPSPSFGDASRSPPARNMLLKLSTQKSSQQEVSAADIKAMNLRECHELIQILGFWLLIFDSKPILD